MKCCGAYEWCGAYGSVCIVGTFLILHDTQQFFYIEFGVFIFLCSFICKFYYSLNIQNLTGFYVKNFVFTPQRS